MFCLLFQPYPVYSYSSIIECSQVICTCTFSWFYTLIGSFWLTGFAHPCLYILPYWSDI